MELVSKRKRIVKIILIVLLSLILCAGAGVGIYFLVREKELSPNLSERQKEFGISISQSGNKLSFEELSLPNFEGELELKSISNVSDDFIVSEGVSHVEVYKASNGDRVSLENNLSKIISIHNNFAVAIVDDKEVLINLTNGKVTCVLNDAYYNFVGDFIIVNAVKGKSIEILLGEQKLVNSPCYVINTKTSVSVLDSIDNSKFVSVDVFGEFFVVYTSMKTSVYRLTNELETVLELENKNQDDGVINYLGFSKNFSFDEFHTVSLLSSNALLVNKRVKSNESQSEQIFSVENQDCFFTNEYYIYFIDSGSQEVLQDQGRVLEAKRLDFGNSYIAITSSKLENKRDVSSLDRVITYYSIEGDDVQSLYQIISYDHIKYGDIVGFKNEKLIMSGGTQTAILDFNGESSNGLIEYAQRLSKITDDMVIYDSVGGLKGLLSDSGDLLHSAIYYKMSPIINSKTVAFKGDYYLLSKDKSVEKIDGFAQEFEEYVLSGIGYYFVNNQNNTYDVFDYNKNLVYDNVTITLNYESLSNVVLMCVNNEKLIKINPIDNSYLLSAQEESVDGLSYSFNNDQTNLELKNALTGLTYVSPFADSSCVKTIYDEELGLASLNISTTIDFENLVYSLNMNDLEEWQKALLPEGVSAIGAYFFVYNDGSVMRAVVGCFKLNGSYIAVVGFNGVYLQSLNITNGSFYYNEISVSSFGGNSGLPCAPQYVNGGYYSDKGYVDWSSSRSQFDGGFVITPISTTLTINELIFKNAYFMNPGQSIVVNATQDMGNFEKVVNDVTIKRRNNIIYITATNGLRVNGSVKVLYGNTEIGSYSGCSNEATINVRNLSSYQEYKISFSLIEWYCALEIEGETYYSFSGYAGGDAPSFGFNNFDRIYTVDHQDRTGYDFKGYNQEGTSTDVIEISSGGKLIENPNASFTGKEIETYKYTPVYEAKKFTMSLNDGTSSTTQEVVYDSPIGINGELRVPTKTGYVFEGWFYGSEQYTSETICKIDSDFELVAKWAPMKINVSFNSNISSFSNIKISGVDYNISKIFFGSDYLSFSRGNAYPASSVKKQVEYDGTFGEMPKLVGLDSTGMQEYTFNGWYETKYGGEKIEETTTVDYLTDITLYARYKRNLITIDVSTPKTGTAYASTGTAVMNIFSYMSYVGSDATGRPYKGTIATNGSGANQWLTVKGNYKAFGYQGDSITFTLTQNKGYYIENIKYVQGGGDEIVLDGVWNSDSPNEYSLNSETSLITTAVEIGETYDTVTVTITFLDDGELMNFKEVYDVANSLTVSYKAKEFTNTFTCENGRVNDTKNINITSSSAYYNQKQEYTLLPVVIKSGIRSWLKSITIDGTEYTFETIYNSGKNEQVLTSLISISATYNNAQKLFGSFTLSVQNRSNHQIDIKFERLTHIDVEAFLGHPDLAVEGYDGFELDTAKLSDIGMVFYDHYDRKTYTYKYQNSMSVFGSTLEITYKYITGYSFHSISLKDSSGVAVEPTKQEDVTGGVKFTFEITDRSKDFLLEIRSQAAKYTVVYENNDREENETNPATGSTPSSTHYYNVWSNLSTNGYQKTGYTFLGYSKDKKFGSALTTSDRDFTNAQLLEENLTSTDGDTVKLYTVFGVKTYTINYNLNDFLQGNGSSNATLSSGAAGTATFDRRISPLKVATRRGYTFNGWFTSPTGGEQVFGGDGDGDLFDINLYNKLEVVESNSSIILYAQWTTIVYNVIIHLNDLTEFNGSSPAFGDIKGYTVEFDKEGDFVLPSGLERAGYDFLGYKSVKLTSDQSKTDTHGYLGYGVDNVRTILNQITLTKPVYEGLRVDDGARTVEVYAVWQAKMMKAYIYLNYENLNLPKNVNGDIEVDGRFKIGTELVGRTTSYTDVFVEFEFDKNSNVTLPEIKPEGYIFKGYSILKDFNPNPNEFALTKRVIKSTIINYGLFQDATYVNSSGESNSLQIGDDTFTIYATYIYDDYDIAYAYQDNSADNPYVYMLGLNDYNTYDHSMVNSSNHIADRKITGVYYGKDVVCDIMAKKGQYIQNIEIKYHNKIKNAINTAKTLSFGWNSGNFTISLNGVILQENYRQLDGYKAYAYQGLYIKVLDYNRNGVDLDNCVQDAVRIIIGFDFVKTDLYIEMGTTIQTFHMVYYRKTSATSTYSGKTYEKDVNYGHKLGQEDLQYGYTPGFIFQNYYYGTHTNVSSEIVQINDEIYDDTNIVALYDKSIEHSVTFYYWDGEKYVVNEEISGEYILGSGSGNSWTKGTNTNYYSLSTEMDENGKPMGGFLTKMPTPSNDQWALSHFAGYVISSSTPSTYFDIKGNASSLPRFDSTTLVEEELHVYPAFVTPYIEVTSLGNQVGADYEFYDIQPNGDVKKAEQSDIQFIWFTFNEYNNYLNRLASYDNNREKTLADALNYNYDARSFVYQEGSYYVSVPSSAGSVYCVCAAIFRYNESGEKYIYLLSDNLLTYSGGTYSNKVL